MRTAGRFGIRPVEPETDFSAVMAYVQKAIERIEPVDSPAALTDTGAEVIQDMAVFSGPDELQAAGRTLSFQRALIGTGTTPALPPVPGLTEAEPLTSDTVWQLTELPSRLVVLGGGPIGCELGQAFARLGSDVTIIEATAHLVPQEEPQAGTALSAALSSKGIQVLTSTTVTKVRKHADEVQLELDGPDAKQIEADRILVVTGRQPRTSGLGMEADGVRLDERGYVLVDDKMRTTSQRIYAGGDVTGILPFTHLAGMHGSIAATNALLAPVRRIHHEQIPWVTFTDPEIAHVGLTEDQARQRYGDAARIRLLSHDHVDRAVTDDTTSGFTHIVLDKKDRVLGVTIVAPRAGEMIAEITSLITRRGRLRDLASVVHPYPAWTDGVWTAAIAEAEGSLVSAPAPHHEHVAAPAASALRRRPIRSEL